MNQIWGIKLRCDKLIVKKRDESKRWMKDSEIKLTCFIAKILTFNMNNNQ